MRHKLFICLLWAIINPWLEEPANAGEYVGLLDAATSPTIDGYRFAVFALAVDGTEDVTVEVESSDFDTYLTLIPPEGQILDNDDAGRNRSMIRFQDPTPGTWYVVVTSYKRGEAGEYRLSVDPGDQLSKEPPDVLSDDVKEQVFDRASRAQERAQLIREQQAQERFDRLRESLGLRSIRGEMRYRIGRSLSSTMADIAEAPEDLAELEELAGQLVVAGEELAGIEPRLELVEQLIRDALNRTNLNAERTIDRLATLVQRSAGLEAALDELAALERSSKELEAARARLLELQDLAQLAVAREQVLSLKQRVDEMKPSYARKIIDSGLYASASVDQLDEGGLAHNLISGWLAIDTLVGREPASDRRAIDVSAWTPALLPWPPPEASARTVLPREILQVVGAELSTLGDVDGRLTAALDATGYHERTYHGVPSGFALVTRLERTNLDGTPADARWSTDIPPIRGFSLRDYIRALFTARLGHFRVMVFIVTSQPFSSSSARARLATIEVWSRTGLNVLPPSVRSAPYTTDHEVTILVYEFEKVRGSRITTVTIPGRLTGQMHLQESGVLAQLER